MRKERSDKGVPKIPPEQRKVKVCYKLRPDVVHWLRAHPRPAAQLIEEAIESTYWENSLLENWREFYKGKMGKSNG